MMFGLKQALALAVAFTGFLAPPALAYPNPGAVKGNGIVGVHDPSVARGADGTYILVSQV